MNETNLNRGDRDLSDVRTAEIASSEQGVVPSSNQQAAATRSFLPEERMTALRKQWEDVQASFVDDPQSAVSKANHLVDELVDELTATFTNERTSLEGQWSGGNVDTEALRVALQRYRAFFNRLLDR